MKKMAQDEAKKNAHQQWLTDNEVLAVRNVQEQERRQIKNQKYLREPVDIYGQVIKREELRKTELAKTKE